MSIVTLLLGSNLGHREGYISAARTTIARQVGIITRQTPILYSEPWGYQSVNGFANQVIQVECGIDPFTLLDTLQEIERQIGRAKHAELGPRYVDRIIDIDILYIDGAQGAHIQSERLTVPHPLIGERDFVLRLLAYLD
ncbi:MAG: 2-amino-4-hydroxy-6-hydroxymethyldihydropteridine diphosphokinase [Mucinivorans sp.]